MLRRTLAGVCVVMIGCGGAAAETPAPDAPKPRKMHASAVALPARSASDDIRRHWPFDDDVQFALYAELRGLADTELVSGLAPALLELAKDSISDVQRACLRELLGAIRELAIGGSGGDHLGLLRFDDGALKPSPGACLQAISGARPTELAGARAAFAQGDDFFALEPGLLIFGTKGSVASALGATGSHPWPAGLDLPNERHLKWRLKVPSENTSAEGSLAASRESFRLDVSAELPSDQAAAMVESQIAKGRRQLAGQVAPQPQAKVVLPIIDALRVTREGRSMTFVFELREPPVDQARDIGMVAALGVYGVRKYLLGSKLAEARETLATIAQREIEAWQSLPVGKRKLASLPPVPRELPHGAKYQSVAEDWKPWRAVNFLLSGPQYFQYEVVASKDGKHADVIARGDLDGDGKASLFKLTLSVSRQGGALEASPQIEETDPEE
jgi:hypothetical protein